MSIKDNILDIRNRIEAACNRVGRNPEDVLLVGVTKLHHPREINEAISSGITDIGENKVQEIIEKYDSVDPVKWHLIGHLQTNKVKYIIDKVDLIHSVDSLKLAKEIEKRASGIDREIDILIQVNPAEEESKFGISIEEVHDLIRDIKDQCPHIKIKGFMCIAPFFDEAEDARAIFAQMKSLYDEYAKENDFRYLSMGMSHDFEVAIEEGANLIRVGTAIFGDRDYRSEEK